LNSTKSSISRFGKLEYHRRELPISILSIVSFSEEGWVPEPGIGRLAESAVTTTSKSEVQSFVKYSGIAFTVFNVLKLCLAAIGANRNKSGVFAARV
jgi:hypothetical protein